MIFEKKIGGGGFRPPPNGSHPAKQPNVTRVKITTFQSHMKVEYAKF